MRRYSSLDEAHVRLARRLREWTRSGLLSPVQRERLEADVRVDLRRTNVFLRLILFGFGLVVVGASVMLAIQLLGLDSEARIASVMLAAGVVAFAVADLLVGRHRLYRFGVEEAFAVASVALAAGGAGLLTTTVHIAERERYGILVALLVGAAASLAVWRRFGYLHAALGAMACAAFAPFQIGMPAAVARTCATVVLVGLFVVVRRTRRRCGDDFPGDDHGILQAAALAGLYLTANLQLTDARDVSRAFYWLTYVATFALPAAGLRLAVRDRDRPLLDVSLAMALTTVITNKPYLGLARQTWDPILFGAALIASAIVGRRWLGHERHGFTADRLLSADTDRLAMLGTASALVQPQLPLGAPRGAPADAPDGGRFGGGGATERW